MYGFKQSEAYREAFGLDEATITETDQKSATPLSNTEPEPLNSKTKTKKAAKTKATKISSAKTTPEIVYSFNYPRSYAVIRQGVSFLLLLSVIPYSLLFEIRIFWWNYAAIPDGLRQPTWGQVENSFIGGLVKFAETGGARRIGQDLYTTPDLLRLLLRWVLVLALILLIYGVADDIEITPQHLRVRYAGSWRKIKWEQVQLLRTAELNEERLIVLIQVDGWGLTALHRVYSLLLGAGWHKSLVITSDIDNFDNLVHYLVYYKSQTMPTDALTENSANPASRFLEDGFVSPLLQGVLIPSTVMETAIEMEPLHLRKNAPHWPTPAERAQLLPKMITVALMIPLLYLVGALLSSFSVWTLVGAVFLFGLGLLEWIFVSYLIFECGRQFALLGGWSNALWVYPQLQGVRVVTGLVTLVLALLLAPGWIIFLLIVAACIWGAVLTAIFTARLYDFGIEKAALAGVGVLLYQGAFLSFYLLLK